MTIAVRTNGGVERTPSAAARHIDIISATIDSGYDGILTKLLGSRSATWSPHIGTKVNLEKFISYSTSTKLFLP